ncbi:PREDICTED: aspartic proteinase nepenthesin-1 [Ipomoea nil]|uniref:aspartic proteinase nepenthesin-1 n=1 Tax=Ipomoea nil TaxID=35883 RepID=UPI0009010FFC|nr:PREDICTED: aspartic proteinase nepenthesin-1 [Ipomoea nil]
MGFSFPLKFLIVIVSVSILLVLPVNSTSRNNGIKRSRGFQVSLRHVDSGGNFTKLERLQRAMKRGRHRLNRLSVLAAVGPLAEDADVKSQIHSGSGEFLMELSIGTPPSPFEAILDTGSDLVWTQCKPCRQCFTQKSPIFDPKKSSSFSKLPCGHKLCAALPMSSCDEGCEYTYAYGDYSTTQGTMGSETFTFDDKVSIPNVAFGCGDDNEGTGFSQGAGLVGLGRGPLSLVSQLTEPKFSYCLTAIGGGDGIDDTSAKSTLLMGSLAGIKPGKSGKVVTTALAKNPLQPSFYYITLKGITVGGTRLPIPESSFNLASDGSGGMIIDSGTTITYLEGKAFEAVKKEFVKQMDLPADTSGSTGLELCFTLPADADDITVPKMIFHFDGEDADLDLPGENYIIADKSSGMACLAMGSSGSMSIFGNVQQQNMLVVHDLTKETLSFVPTQCDQL